jgi:hypothetical protein
VAVPLVLHGHDQKPRIALTHRVRNMGSENQDAY